MNVALTRAKSSLFILGHAPTLERSDENWRKIIHDAKSRSCMIEVSPCYRLIEWSVANLIINRQMLRTLPLHRSLIEVHLSTDNRELHWPLHRHLLPI